MIESVERDPVEVAGRVSGGVVGVGVVVVVVDVDGVVGLPPQAGSSRFIHSSQ